MNCTRSWAENAHPTRSLLFRIRNVTDADFRLVALSATLGEGLPKYCEWMRPGESDRVLQIVDTGERKEVSYRIHAALATDPQDHAAKPGGPDELGIPGELIRDIHAAFAGRKTCFSPTAVKTLSVSRMPSTSDAVRRAFRLSSSFIMDH